MSSSLIAAIPASSPPRAELLDCLSRVPDPRDPRGICYPLVSLLAVAVTAALAGARSFTAIGEWAAALAPESLIELGLDQAPVESTLRKLFARLDTTGFGSPACPVRLVPDPADRRPAGDRDRR